MKMRHFSFLKGIPMPHGTRTKFSKRSSARANLYQIHMMPLFDRMNQLSSQFLQNWLDCMWPQAIACTISAVYTLLYSATLPLITIL